MTERYKGWSILVTRVKDQHDETWEYSAVQSVKGGPDKKIRGAEYPSELDARMGARRTIDSL